MVGMALHIHPAIHNNTPNQNYPDPNAKSLQMPVAIAINKNGQTYGTIENNRTPDKAPDLIACIGIDGTEGYCKKTDLFISPAKNPEEALKYMAQLEKTEAASQGKGDYTRTFPLYKSDGVTVIGSFGVSKAG
jgi:hypothetical protein